MRPLFRELGRNGRRVRQAIVLRLSWSRDIICADTGARDACRIDGERHVSTDFNLAMLSLAAFVLVSLGLGGLVPWRDSGAGPLWGLRYFSGASVLVIGLFIVDFVAGLSFGVAAWAMIALAAVIAAVDAIRHRRHAARFDWLGHPVAVLPVMAIVVLAARGGIDYLPVAWDEYANWIAWARSGLVADDLDGAGLIHSAPRGYTPGWPHLLAFGTWFAGRFDIDAMAMVPMALHLGLIGLTFDAVMLATIRSGAGRWLATATSWLVVLLLLAVEASWKLAPTLLLIEKPQIYLIAGMMVLGLMMRDETADRRALSLHLGIALAAGYLIKVATAVFVLPAAMILGAAIWRRPAGSRTPIVLCGLVPFAVVYVLWQIQLTDPSCLARPVLVLERLVAGGVSPDRAADLGGRYAAALGGYLAAYKSPLSALALVGLLTGFMSRRLAVVPLAFLAYAAVYFSALYLYHLTCLGEFYFEQLNSIQRFTRVPLRTLHWIGPVIPLLVALERGWKLPAWRPAHVGLSAAAAALLIWQAVQLDASFREMSERRAQGADSLKIVRQVRREAALLRDLLDRRGLGAVAVTQIVQGGTGFSRVIARYEAIGERRGEAMQRFRAIGRGSWGAAAANRWMTVSARSEVADILLRTDVVWPLKLDDWIRDVLDPLIDDAACRRRPMAYFMFPDRERRMLSCVLKDPGR